jgi:hypothetical protein
VASRKVVPVSVCWNVAGQRAEGRELDDVAERKCAECLGVPVERLTTSFQVRPAECSHVALENTRSVISHEDFVSLLLFSAIVWRWRTIQITTCSSNNNSITNLCATPQLEYDELSTKLGCRIISLLSKNDNRPPLTNHSNPASFDWLYFERSVKTT